MQQLFTTLVVLPSPQNFLFQKLKTFSTTSALFPKKNSTLYQIHPLSATTFSVIIHNPHLNQVPLTNPHQNQVSD
jgi:hypothetical protein